MLEQAEKCVRMCVCLLVREFSGVDGARQREQRSDRAKDEVFLMVGLSRRSWGAHGATRLQVTRSSSCNEDKIRGSMPSRLLRTSPASEGTWLYRHYSTCFFHNCQAFFPVVFLRSQRPPYGLKDGHTQTTCVANPLHVLKESKRKR